VTDDPTRYAFPRADADGPPPEDLSDHQTYVPGRGIYDERNRVNDLTGREWKVGTKSVIAQSYPPDIQFDLRSDHGGQKPPRLCRDLIERFSKSGDRVLDPFAGVGGTLLGAALCEHEGTGRRAAVGFERNRRWVRTYETVVDAENDDRTARGDPPLARGDLRHGDCARLIDDIDPESVDFLCTDVPYWNMDRVEQTRNPDETRESGLGAFDADVDADADADADVDPAEGTAEASTDQPTTPTDQPVTREEWLADMRRKFEGFVPTLAPGAYAAVFIGDMYRESAYRFLSADLARALSETQLVLKANLVWYDPSKELHVFGYPYAFVPSMVHQNILVFRKPASR
jgi:DNA modification methylase